MDPELSPALAPPPSHDRQRRKSVSHPSARDDAWSSRRAHVVASDDGRAPRDAYSSAYPERTSRHDIEAKTSDRSRQFREQRRGYESDEGERLRRAKSHSPRRAARDAHEIPRYASPQVPSKSARAEDGYGSDHHRSSARPARAPQQYYGEDAYGSRGKSRERGVISSGGKEYAYGAAPAAMPRPPAGDYGVYKSSPLSPKPHGGSDGSRHSRHSADKPTAHGGSSAYPKDYESHRPSNRASRAPPPPAYEEKHARASAPNKSATYDDHGYPPRGRERPLPTRVYDDDDDAYGRAPRARQRQSVPPPQARSRYPEYEDDGYGAPPRRAASVNHPHHRQHQGRDGGEYDEGPGKKAYPEDRAGGPPRPRAHTAGGEDGAARPTTSAQRERQKKWGKQAGKYFMTHAVPVIKKEAVPLLTKAAQAYIQQKAR